MKEPRIKVSKSRKRRIFGREAYYEYLKSEAWLKKKKFFLNNTARFLKRRKMHELKKAYGLAKMRDLRRWLREGAVSLTELLPKQSC